MSWKDCTAAIEAAAGRRLTDEEADAILTALTRRTAYKQAAGGAVDPARAAQQAAGESSHQARLSHIYQQGTHTPQTPPQP